MPAPPLGENSSAGLRSAASAFSAANRWSASSAEVWAVAPSAAAAAAGAGASMIRRGGGAKLGLGNGGTSAGAPIGRTHGCAELALRASRSCCCACCGSSVPIRGRFSPPSSSSLMAEREKGLPPIPRRPCPSHGLRRRAATVTPRGAALRACGTPHRTAGPPTSRSRQRDPPTNPSSNNSEARGIFAARPLLHPVSSPWPGTAKYSICRCARSHALGSHDERSAHYVPARNWGTRTHRSKF